MAVAGPQEITQLKQQAEILLKSGLLPESLKTPEQVVTIILKGRELGLSPLVALEHIYAVKGRSALDGQAIQVLIRRAGHSFDVIEQTADHCTIEFCRKAGRPYRVTVTMAEAKTAGWNMEPEYEEDPQTHKRKKVGMREKHTWKTMPAQMLYWRCLAKGARMGMADALNNTELLAEVAGEMEERAMVDAEGEIADEYMVIRTPDGLDIQRKADLQREQSFLAQSATRGRNKLFKTTAAPKAEEAAESDGLQPTLDTDLSPQELHWIDDKDARTRFWARTTGKPRPDGTGGLGLTRQQVYDACKVDHMRQWPNDEPSAVKVCEQYARELRQKALTAKEQGTLPGVN